MSSAFDLVEKSKYGKFILVYKYTFAHISYWLRKYSAPTSWSGDPSGMCIHTPPHTPANCHRGLWHSEHCAIPFISDTHTHTLVRFQSLLQFVQWCIVGQSSTLSFPTVSHFSSFGRSLSTLKSKLTHYTAYGSSSKVSTVCVLFVLADVLVEEPRQKFKHLLAGF